MIKKWLQLDWGEPLLFGCNRCGDCCRHHDIPLNHHDILQVLQVKSHLSLPELFKLIPAGENLSEGVLIDGQPMLVFLQNQPKDQGCIFLNPDQTCGIYEQRPITCRVFPFHQNARGALEIAPAARLQYDISCDKTPCTRHLQREVGLAIKTSLAEFQTYRQMVKVWNDLVASKPHDQSLEAFITWIQQGNRL